MEELEKCPKCNGTGMVKDKDGSVHVCWDCLREGRLDVHSKNIPDSKIKI
jgi:Ribonuclease G/E